MTTAQQGVRSSAYAVELRTAAPMIRALGNAMVCAGRDDTLPVLQAVQFHFDGESILELRSTDRHVALFEQVSTDAAAPKSPAFHLLLPYAACQQAVAFLKSVPKTHPVDIEWEPRNEPPADWSGTKYELGTLRLRSYEASTELTTLEGDSPKLPALVPSESGLTPVEAIGFSRHTLERMAKVKSESRQGYVRARFHGPSKLIRLDWQEEPRTVLVMPIRITSEDWGVPGL